MIEWFARKSINRLRRMLQAIRSNDFGIRFPEEKLHGPERELASEINEVITDFRQQLLRQERKYGQYEALINTIGTSLIVTDNDGNVRFMNRHAIDNLCGFRINHLSALESFHRELPSALRSLSPGQSRLLSVSTSTGKEMQLNVSMACYLVEGETTFLYSIENVDLLLLENEIEAQRKLVSVLTHEIMNSLSPIISLSDTLCNSHSTSPEETAMALRAIKRRSQGLLTFVENYRKLSKLAPPRLQWTVIGEIFEELKRLYPDPFMTYEISDSDIQLCIDRHQIVQVLINLVKNGIEACDEKPHIKVCAKADHPGRRFIMSVTDNGCGISHDAIDRIFVPFFTTKPGGSGIGLSLSRQIINSHGGSLEFLPSEKGTTFSVILPLVYRQ